MPTDPPDDGRLRLHLLIATDGTAHCRQCVLMGGDTYYARSLQQSQAHLQDHLDMDHAVADDAVRYLETLAKEAQAQRDREAITGVGD